MRLSFLRYIFLLDVLVNIVSLHPLGDYHLHQLGRVNIARLLADGHLRDYRRGSDREADTDAGRKNLRERAGINDDSVLVEALYIRNIFARNAQIAVGVVLKNHNIVRFRELIELAALLERHRNARGILEVRNSIYHFCVRVLVKSLFESLDIHAVRIDGHADELRVI